MTPRGPRLRRRRGRPLAAIGLAVLALLLAGALAFRLLTRESATPASVRAALARFRALPPAARTLPPRLRGRVPQPGVYVYATRGAEVSHVLGTRRHRYPPRTAVTVSVTPSGCVRTRWDVLATRWDGTLACARGGPAGAGGWRLVDQSEEHEFAGHVDRRAYACTRASTARPARLTDGARWASVCAIPGTTTADAVTVLGPRTLTLDGRRVRTLLLRTRTRVSGDTVGRGAALAWVLPGSGLVVRRTLANASATSTVVGAVRYDEAAALTLRSPRPLR